MDNFGSSIEFNLYLSKGTTYLRTVVSVIFLKGQLSEVTTINKLGKVSAQPHTIVKQICFPNGNVMFLSLFSLFKNWMHNVGWGCAEILP